jgi:hypothetical protein
MWRRRAQDPRSSENGNRSNPQQLSKWRAPGLGRQRSQRRGPSPFSPRAKISRIEGKITALKQLFRRFRAVVGSPRAKHARQDRFTG